jgi:hypothetical protein
MTTVDVHVSMNAEVERFSLQLELEVDLIP